MSQTSSFIYAALKPWVKLGARLFFRKTVVHNLHNFPSDKPVLLVANHQNAMLDPVLLCITSRRQLHWLTRADVFRNPFVSRLLHKLNMMPVYRERDRVADISERNEGTFNMCYERMRAGGVICIFPEGTHRGKKQLVPLKKGMSRMVIGALDRGIKDLVVLPVALDYENYYEYRKTLLINFGKPLQASEFLDADLVVNGRTQARITEAVRAALSALMIDIRNDNVYHEIMSLKPLVDKISSADVGPNFDRFRRLSCFLDQENDTHHFLNHEVNDYRSLMHDLKINEDHYREKYSLLKMLLILAAIPFAICATVLFSPVYALTERFVGVKVKDPLFRNSIRLTFWTFLAPILLLVYFFVAQMISGNALRSMTFVGITLLSGIITLYWWRSWKIWMQYMKCTSYRRKGNRQYLQWIKVRSGILDWINHQEKRIKNV